MLALAGVQGFSRDELVASPGQPQQCCGADEEGARVSQGDCLGSQGRPAGRRGWELKPCWPLTGCILCLLSPHESVLQDSTLSCQTFSTVCLLSSSVTAVLGKGEGAWEPLARCLCFFIVSPLPALGPHP